MHPNRLIVALDVPERAHALELARALAPHVGMVKIGLELFIAHGPALVRDIRRLGIEVFLDLKLHDIPNTVASAARRISDLDVRLLTVHAGGGAEMLRQARAALAPHTQLLAVTVLTSFDDATLVQLGFSGGTAETALRLGELALQSGADGLVCSALELPTLAALSGVRVVPGIRPAGAAAGDQKRVATPREAIAAGATWIVVGRPIIAAPDPVAAAQAMVAELGSLS